MSRYRHLVRDRLVERALRGEPALVLLWGGGGTGKSTAAAQIAERLSDDGAPAVWVRLGDGSAGAGGAWQSIFSALLEARLIPEDCAAARLHEGELVSGTDRVLEAFRTDAPERLVLVLDDVHLITDAEFESSLLRALGSRADTRVILTSRARLPRLLDIEARVRIPVTEIDSRELRLTGDEIDRLLIERIPALDADERERIGTGIGRASEGWPIAVHASVIDYAANGRPPTATQREFVTGYVDRLLAGATDQRRALLCATALFEEISASIVAAAFDLDTTAAAALLEGAVEASAGYWDEPDGTRWYRQHELIRDELQRRAASEIGDERLRELHRRAAAAFSGVRLRSAVVAALHAEAWDLLQSMLLEGWLQRVVRRDERTNGLWLRDIPDAVRERYPVLAAFALIDEYAFPRGRFERVLRGFKALAGSQLAVESAKAGLPGAVASALRMVAARLSGNEDLGARMAERFEEVVDQLDEHEAEAMRRPLRTGITQACITHLHAERFDDAERLLHRIDPERDREAIASVHVLALQAFADAWRGWMTRADEAIARCERSELPEGWHSAYVGAGYRIAAAVAALEAGDVRAAEAHIEALAPHEPTIEHWPYLVALRALICELRSGPRAALSELEWQVNRRRRRFATLSSHRRMLAELQARLRWQAGAEPSRGAGRQRDLSGADALLSSPKPDAGRAPLRSLQQREGLGGFPRRKAEILLLQAESARRVGDDEAAVRFGALAAHTMEDHALVLPSRAIPPAGMRALVELQPALAPWTVAEPATSTPGLGALTDAELRTLFAIAEHGTTAAAAQALYLSRETVKWHLARVYRKLGVNNRSAAIRVAADAGLLGTAPRGTGAARKP